jgi:hypothetical protein
VGVIEVTNKSRQIAFKMIRRGKSVIVTDKSILLSFLNKSDLLLLTRKKFKTNNDSTKSELETHASTLPVIELRNFVLNVLKKRYQETSNTFLKQKSQNTTQHELQNLSRFKKAKNLTPQLTVSTNRESYQQNIIEINHELIIKKFGNIPENFPTFVRKRAIH